MGAVLAHWKDLGKHIRCIMARLGEASIVDHALVSNGDVMSCDQYI